MMRNDAFAEVMAQARQTVALEQVMGRLGWDQETVMPPGSAEQRGEEMAALEGVLHAAGQTRGWVTWLARCEAPDAAGAAQLRAIARGACAGGKGARRPGAGDCPGNQRGAGHLGRGAGARGHCVLPADPGRCDPAEARGRGGAARGGDPYDALVDDYEPA